MLNIVLFGPPGAGKGTQSDRLVDKYNLIHLSTGDIFRSNIREKTDLGLMAKNYMNKGELVPDSVTIKMLQMEVLKNSKANGFIFDGFPRTNAQAQALDNLLNDLDTDISLMLSLDVKEKELKNRLLKRAKISGRTDDADESIIMNRIAIYNKETAPVKEFYLKQSKLILVDGQGEIEDIANRLNKAIDSL